MAATVVRTVADHEYFLVAGHIRPPDAEKTRQGAGRRQKIAGEFQANDNARVSVGLDWTHYHHSDHNAVHDYGKKLRDLLGRFGH